MYGRVFTTAYQKLKLNGHQRRAKSIGTNILVTKNNRAKQILKERLHNNDNNNVFTKILQINTNNLLLLLTSN